MKNVRRSLSAVLALALLLGCMGWTPTRAEEATLETNPGTVTENIQAQDSAEKMDILQQEEARYPYRTKANSAVTSFPADMADGIRLEGAYSVMYRLLEEA